MSQDEVALSVCHRVGWDGKIYSGALCKACIRSFILDMAYAEPLEFEKLIEEARNPPRE